MGQSFSRKHRRRESSGLVRIACVPYLTVVLPMETGNTLRIRHLSGNRGVSPQSGILPPRATELDTGSASGNDLADNERVSVSCDCPDRLFPVTLISSF